MNREAVLDTFAEPHFSRVTEHRCDDNRGDERTRRKALRHRFQIKVINICEVPCRQ